MFLAITTTGSTPPPPRLCSRCGTRLNAHSEKCPGCGKDSSHGTQFLSLIVVTGFLITVPLLVLIVMYFFVTP